MTRHHTQILSITISTKPIVESLYKSRRRFVFGIWTCAKLKKVSRIQDVHSVTFPQDECHGREHQKVQKLYLKSKKERHGMKKSPGFN